MTTRRQNAWTLTNEHRITLRSAISNKTLPVIIAQVISSYFNDIAAEYLMVHHRAVNDYFDQFDGPSSRWERSFVKRCQRSFVVDLTVGLFSKSGAGKSSLVHKYVMDDYVEEYGVIDLSIKGKPSLKIKEYGKSARIFKLNLKYQIPVR